MMITTGVMPSAAGPVGVDYYFDDLLDVIRLAAAVLWRHSPRAGRRPTARPRAPRAWLRRLRHRLWRHFGPLGMDVRIGLPGTPPSSGRAASFAPDGELLSYFDASRRTVRVVDRTYPLPPDGRALVLLVDDGDPSVDEPRVTTRLVPAVSRPLPRWTFEAPAPGSEAAGERDARAMAEVREASAAWEAAIRVDPEVRAFLDADGTP